MSKSSHLRNFCSSWLRATLILALFAAPVTAQPIRSPIPPDLSIAKIEDFAFPREIAGLTRNGKTDYNMPGAGFSISYGKPGQSWADIYIYDRQRNLTSGSALALARKELEAAIDDVHAQIKLGRYSSVELKDQSVSGSFAKARLVIEQGGREFESFIFVTVRKGKFVKVRLTDSVGPRSDRLANTFLKEYSQSLGGV